MKYVHSFNGKEYEHTGFRNKRKKITDPGVLKDSEFFEQLSILSGLDVESVKRVYYAVIRLLSRRLRLVDHVRMPEWGHFSLILHQNRNIYNRKTKTTAAIGVKRLVKYQPAVKLKNYFKDMPLS